MNVSTTHVLKTQSDVINPKVELRNIVNQVWEDEDLDSSENAFVIKKFQNEVNFNEGRYVVKLPFKKKKFPLEDNYDVAMSLIYVLSNPLLRALFLGWRTANFAGA